MVSPRFTTFLLISILLLLIFSIALSTLQHQASLALNQEIYQGVPAVGESDEIIRTKIVLGRKMMSESGNNIEKVQRAARNCAIGECNDDLELEEGKGILGPKHSKISTKRNIGYYRKKKKAKKMSTLVPLNADYYVPRPHPPKNN